MHFSWDILGFCPTFSNILDLLLQTATFPRTGPVLVELSDQFRITTSEQTSPEDEPRTFHIFHQTNRGVDELTNAPWHPVQSRTGKGPANRHFAA